MPLQVAPELSDDERAFFYLLHLLGEKGRATLRSELLKAAENEEARNLLNRMNHIDRIRDTIRQEGSQGS